MRILLLCTVVLSTLFSTSVWAKRKRSKYVVDIKVLESVARTVKGMPRKQMLKKTEELIKGHYPELVDISGKWTFNSVGGSLAQVKIIYCSTREYIALWGSPMNTEGFSGRYNKMDVWDIMLDGKMESYAPGEHEVTKYANGVKDSFLPRGKGVHYRLLEGGAYMIDYGRGNVTSSLKDGVIIGHRNVTGDKKSKNEMLKGCAKNLLANLFKIKTKRKYQRLNSSED